MVCNFRLTLSTGRQDPLQLNSGMSPGRDAHFQLRMLPVSWETWPLSTHQCHSPGMHHPFQDQNRHTSWERCPFAIQKCHISRYTGSLTTLDGFSLRGEMPHCRSRVPCRRVYTDPLLLKHVMLPGIHSHSQLQIGLVSRGTHRIGNHTGIITRTVSIGRPD